MNYELKRLNKIHFFLGSKPVTQEIMAQVPAVGDVVRVAENIYGRVYEVTWCLDEDSSPYTRANVGLEEIEE